MHQEYYVKNRHTAGKTTKVVVEAAADLDMSALLSGKIKKTTPEIDAEVEKVRQALCGKEGCDCTRTTKAKQTAGKPKADKKIKEETQS